MSAGHALTLVAGQAFMWNLLPDFHQVSKHFFFCFVVRIVWLLRAWYKKKKKTLITPALVGEAWWESEISVRMVRKQLNNYNATPEHPYSCSQGGIQSKQETRIVCMRVSVSACLCWKVSLCLHLENVYDINVRKQPLVHCSQIHIDRNKSRNKQEQEDRTAVIKKSLLIVLFLLFSFEKQANITALLLIMKT